MPIFQKDPLQIIVYQSYGTKNHFYTRGRALQDENINLDKKSFFHLFINSWKRFETDEVKHTLLTITLPNQHKFYTKTDHKGYFIVDESIENFELQPNSKGWFKFDVSYTYPEDVNRKIVCNNLFKGELEIPNKNVDFGVISDIDDTILDTGVVSTLKWRLLFNTFFKSPFRRIALESASKFYRKLHKGSSGINSNPMFYVSHSPWNLYRYLRVFLVKNNFPKGAVLLRNMPNFFRSKKDEKPQKYKEIINIFKTYKNLSFVLIGDAGEYDIDIYMEITSLYPNRVKAIYLKSVQSKKRIKRIKELTKDYDSTIFLLVNSYNDAIEHAKQEGFIQ
jgi:phosphatidate phosphatase APP1